MFKYGKFCNDNYSIDELSKMKEIEEEIHIKQNNLEFWNNTFNLIGKNSFKYWLFDGFDNYEDYCKYGDAFVKVDK